MGDLTDLAVIDVSDIALVAQLTNRRDDSRSTGAEYFLELAFLGCLHDISDGQTLLGNRDAPLLEQLDARHTGNTGQNGANAGSGINGAVDLKEAVHGADFLNVLMLNAIQPQGLLVAQIVRLDLRNQRSCVVTAALGKAGTARACTGVLVLDEDLNRVDAGGVVRANRRADDDKLMGCRRTNAQMRLGRNDKRTDVQTGALLMGYPILVGLDQRLDCLNEVLGRQRRQAHTMVGVLHTLCVAVGTEQLYRAVGQTVCLHALKGLHCIVQNHGSRVECERLIGHDACVMPSLTLGVVNDEHVVGVVFAKAQSRFVGLFFLILGQFVADVEHDNFTLFC